MTEKCTHSWRQYWDLQYGSGQIEPHPQGFYCIKCLERRLK